MRLALFFLCFGVASAAWGREAKEQRARRDTAARELLTALDDREATGVRAAVKVLAENLEPEGVPVFAPLKLRLEAIASELIAARGIADSRFRAAISDTTDIFGVDTAPALTPDRDLAKSLFKNQCRACHGEAGAGDGELAVKVKGGVPSFVTGLAAAKSPFALYQKIAGGKPGTPMPGYDKKLEPMALWALAYWCAAFDARPPARDPDVPALLKRGLTLDRLARLDDAELATWFGDPTLLGFLRAKAPFLPSIPRFAPH